MDRREFLRRALTLAPVAIALPSAVSYFLAPRTGWPRWPQRMTATEVLARQVYPSLEPVLDEASALWRRAYEDMALELSAHGVAGLDVGQFPPRVIRANEMLGRSFEPLLAPAKRNWFTFDRRHLPT